MISILRQPDYVFGATESSPFIFEEAASKTNDVTIGGKPITGLVAFLIG